MARGKNIFLLAALFVVAGFWVRTRLRLSDLERQIAAVDPAETSLLMPPLARTKATTVPRAKNANASPPVANPHLNEWLERIASLKRWIAQNPDRQTPGLDSASPEEWLKATFNNPLRTEADFQRAHFSLSKLVRTRETRARM